MKRVATAVLVLAVALPSLAAATPRQFAGRGNTTLAPFTLKQPATLRWQRSGGLLGGLFALKMLYQRSDVPNPQLVFSRARSGTVRLPPGRYVLRVDTLGGTQWQITIG